MAPRTVVITGASDGIGAAAARALAARGDEVVLVGRSAAKTRAVAERLEVEHHVADFAELDQVRALAADLAAAHPRIGVLANNAGGIMGERTLTVDGHELTLQVNHLAPFLLTHLLLPQLQAGRASVIQTSSVAARVWGRLDLDDLDGSRDYSPERAYGDAKLANLLFTRELDRRYASAGLSAVALHPGIVRTSFASDTTHPMRWFYGTPGLRRVGTISPEHGADTLVWLATSRPGEDWERGGFYARRRPVRRVSSQTDDAALAAGLWERSAERVGLA